MKNSHEIIGLFGVVFLLFCEQGDKYCYIYSFNNYPNEGVRDI